MGDVQAKINGVSLDNGSWRTIVDWPAIIRSDDGRQEKFAVDFLIEADTAAEMDSRWESTYDDFTTKNPRLQVWLDDSKATPTIDWYVGDNTHLSMVSIVSMRPEANRTQKKILMTLVVSADCEPPQTLGGPVSELGADIQGLATTLEVAKHYMGSERYMLTASGVFVSTLNESAEGPYDLASVANNSGKARFSLEAPDVIVASFDEGMFIDVSSPSAYEGRHFITAISGGGATIDTDTDYVSVEGDVGATVLVGTTTTAEDNFQNGKSQILVNLLETGTNGQPNATAPHMTKIAETISFTSEQKDALEFVLGSAPESELLAATSGGNYVQRGLQYNVVFAQPPGWDSKLVAPIQMITIEGKVGVQKDAVTDTFDLTFWWNQMEAEIIAAVEAISNQRFGGSLRHRGTRVYIDYTTLDIQFTIECIGAYNGTVSYSARESFSEKQLRTVWSDTDGYDHIQEPKGATRKMATVTVDWIGDAGNFPPTPKPPKESGFLYLYSSSEIGKQERLEDEDGNLYDSVSMSFHFERFRPKEGGPGPTPQAPVRPKGPTTGQGHAGRFG